MGCSPWGHKEPDTTEQQTLSVYQSEYEIFSVVFLTEILLTILSNVSCDKTRGFQSSGGFCAFS